MKESPIIFNGEMVRAILEGRKTQTRRVIVPRQKAAQGFHICRDNKNQIVDIQAYDEHESHIGTVHPPYGYAGDLLWVKENYGVAWHQGAFIDPTVNYQATLERFPIVKDETILLWQAFYAKKRKKPWNPEKWYPSIFMPKFLTRIWLKLKNMRIERLQDISEEDAKAEGVTLAADIPELGDDGKDTYRDAFFRLWNHLNSARGYGLAKNPWLWVEEFERVER